MSSCASGTVTFLFTDIEGSTRLWEEHPDAMQGALARHDELVRGAIESHGGYVVKTTGDRFHAAFSAAEAGVSAAVAAQRALDGEVWALPEPLRVRIGLHTGTASLRDGAMARAVGPTSEGYAHWTGASTRILVRPGEVAAERRFAAELQALVYPHGLPDGSESDRRLRRSLQARLAAPSV